jgi:hypothetical protein
VNPGVKNGQKPGPMIKFKDNNHAVLIIIFEFFKICQGF